MKTRRYGPLIVLAVLVCFGMAFGDVGEREKAEEKKPESICPHTLFKDSCLNCHVMSGGKFRLKDTPLDAHEAYPAGFKLMNYGQPNQYGYYEVGDIDYATSNKIKEIFEFCRNRNIKRVVFEILSGGGNVFLGWRIKSMMDEFKADGFAIETKCTGIAASAAFLVFLNGSVRVANATSEMMMHELRSFKGGFLYFEEVTPSGAEEEAKVYKHLQGTITNWIASKGNIPVEKLEQMLKFKEFWMTGKEAKEYGFADVVY